MRWQDGPLYFHDGVAGGWPMIVLMAIMTAAVVVAVVFLVRYLVRATPPARVGLAAAAAAPGLAAGPGAPAPSRTEAPTGGDVAAPGGESAGGEATLPLAPASSAQDLLKRRYAAGEIDREEYLQKLQDL